MSDDPFVAYDDFYIRRLYHNSRVALGVIDHFNRQPLVDQRDEFNEGAFNNTLSHYAFALEAMLPMIGTMDEQNAHAVVAFASKALSYATRASAKGANPILVATVARLATKALIATAERAKSEGWKIDFEGHMKIAKGDRSLPPILDFDELEKHF